MPANPGESQVEYFARLDREYAERLAAEDAAKRAEADPFAVEAESARKRRIAREERNKAEIKALQLRQAEEAERQLKSEPTGFGGGEVPENIDRRRYLDQAIEGTEDTTSRLNRAQHNQFNGNV